ncbi:MAG: VWA domain-containing protein [Dysgonamonadaceae bacterium]|jgi:Ca-activated chloride channel family protein|nr:VWA domain-containing protein [Dysgonamonadaceae bacterium]
MIFANPLYFWLLLLLIPMIGWYIWKLRKSQASFQISASQGFDEAPVSYKVYLRHLPFAFRVLCLIFLIIALARPQSTDNWENSTTEGIDIMMVMDTSSSMLAEDFKPNRLEAAKEVAASFIAGRPNDNIGLVVFARESYTLCPLTTDRAALMNLLKDVKIGMIEDGTAIGHGLANAVSRLKDSQAKSKVVILLTDGVNNSGEITPLTAGEIAKKYGIRVYTVGVGAKGTAPYPVQVAGRIVYQNILVDIDEDVLTQIAQMTGGKYFRATNKEALKRIYEEIDQMEKTKISVQEYSKKQEEFLPFALLALLFLLLELLLRHTLLRNIP